MKVECVGSQGEHLKNQEDINKQRGTFNNIAAALQAGHKNRGIQDVDVRWHRWTSRGPT